MKRSDKNEDLLLKTTKMHEAIARSSWQLKLNKTSNIEYEDKNIDSNMSK